jgi:predicted permease
VFRVVVPDRFSEAQRRQFYRAVIDQIGAIPGVSETAVVSNVFMSSTPNATIQVEGRPQALQAATKVIDDVASPEFFTALKVPLRGGRSFTEHDTDRAPHVAVVNERFAREFWPGESPIGRRFQFLDGRFDDPWITVIGIVGDMRRNGLEQPALPQVFLPFAQSPSRGADIVVTAGRQPLAHASTIRKTISGIHPGVPAYEISTLEERVSSLFAVRRFQTLLLWIFAAAGILLSVMGLYGITRLVAAERQREIGIRIAIGASTISVVTMFLKEGLVLTLVGLGIGLAVAAALTQMLSTLVYGVSTTDPFTFAVAPAVLICTAILACVEPAWRAARVDPLLTLRCE